MMLKNLSIILPTLNERDNIVPLAKTINRLYQPLEIIIVDDSSTDGTDTVVMQYMKTHQNVRLTKNTPPLGLAPSLQLGINQAGGKYVLWMDADFSHPPEIIGSMMKHMSNADIVVGSWLIRGGEDKRKEVVAKFFSRIINKICQLCFNPSIHAYTSGYILTKRALFKNFRLEGNYGEYCILFLVKQAMMGKRIIEVPFVCVSRRNGKTKTSPSVSVFLKRGMGYVKTIILLCFTSFHYEHKET